jgi:hypothetical protein
VLFGLPSLIVVFRLLAVFDPPLLVKLVVLIGKSLTNARSKAAAVALIELMFDSI